METINVFLKLSLTKKWMLEIQNDFNNLYEFKFHNSLDSIKNELDIKKLSSIAIIDLEDINYKLYTKAYYSGNNNVKFIGIGLKKGVEQIIDIIDSNISSYVSIENNSFELVKAIKHVQKGKVYFCDETKDHLIENYISSVKSNKTNINFENTIIVDNRKVQLKTEALTEREKKVTSLLAQGLSYKEIANLLEVTTFAINQNAKSIFKKLKVRSRSELSFRIMG
jgi:DNA-binding NarL/FixJ family response regulator